MATLIFGVGRNSKRSLDNTFGMIADALEHTRVEMHEEHIERMKQIPISGAIKLAKLRSELMELEADNAQIEQRLNSLKANRENKSTDVSTARKVSL